VPLFANGLQLRHNALPLALGRGREFITWAVVLCGTAKRGCSCLLWVKTRHRLPGDRFLAYTPLPWGRCMADYSDYYSTIARAISGLPSKTQETRGRFTNLHAQHSRKD
jgi:hypothetical protein